MFFFYFDCVQLAIGWRGHVTLHMRGRRTVQNQNKNLNLPITCIFFLAYFISLKEKAKTNVPSLPMPHSCCPFKVQIIRRGIKERKRRIL